MDLQQRSGGARPVSSPSSTASLHTLLIEEMNARVQAAQMRGYRSLHNLAAVTDPVAGRPWAVQRAMCRGANILVLLVKEVSPNAKACQRLRPRPL